MGNGECVCDGCGMYVGYGMGIRDMGYGMEIRVTGCGMGIRDMAYEASRYTV